MFRLTRNETKLIQEGGARSVTRRYPSGCPHQVGAQIILSSEYADPPATDEVPFAVATIVSVRPITVGAMRRTPELCQMDGFGSPAEWHGHLLRLYPGLSDDAQLYRLQLRVDEMDKHIAERLQDLNVPAPQPEPERVYVD